MAAQELAKGPARSTTQRPAKERVPDLSVADLPPLSHVTVVGPRRRVDLTVPADVPLTHLMPDIVKVAGESGDPGTPGWSLQRIGGPPFDFARSLGSLGILEGEVLYLRPRAAAIPPASFDDVADVVATGVKGIPGRWSPAHTRWSGLIASAAILSAGPVILLTGPMRLVTALFAGVLALVLVTAGGALARAGGDSAAGALVGYFALPYAFVSGFSIPAGPGTLTDPGAPAIMAACAVTLLTAAIAGVTVADGIPGYVAAAVGSFTGLVSAALATLLQLPAAGVATGAITLLIALSTLIPKVSFQLGRLQMPTMPTNAEELRGDREEVSGPSVMSKARDAHDYATGFVAGISLVAVVTAGMLALHPGVFSVAALGVMSLVLILRARAFHGAGQRLWLLAAGVSGLVMLGITGLSGGGLAESLAVLLALPTVALVPAAIGLWLPRGRKPSPFWGRAADIIEFVLIAALIPLAIGVLEMYGWARGLVG